MSKSRLGPEAKIITLFAALSEDSRRIVLDVLKSQSATPRKTTSKKPPASPAAQKEPTADNGLKCGICGNVRDHHDHDRTYIQSHDFDTPPKSVARAKRGSKQKTEAASSTQNSGTVTEGVTDAALAASGGVSGD